jgi:hypothetical protein
MMWQEAKIHSSFPPEKGLSQFFLLLVNCFAVMLEFLETTAICFPFFTCSNFFIVALTFFHFPRFLA